MRRQKVSATGLICFLWVGTLWVCPEARGSCASVSVRALCVLLGKELTEEEWMKVVDWDSRDVVSMLDIERAAETFLGIELVGVSARWQELSRISGTKILHLSDPDHFLVLARSSADWVQLVDGGQIVVVPRAEMEKRYSGHALLLKREARTGGPRLELPEFHYPFGILGVGQEASHAFTVKNVGDKELTVSVLKKTCCGAPKVEVAKEELAPGESTQVTVSFPISYSGDVFKSAQLLTTDADQPVVFLTVHGYVPPDEKVYPDRFYLAAEKGAELTRTLRLEGPAEMDLVEAKCDGGLCTVKAGEPVVERGVKRWELSLTSGVGNRVGEFKDTLTIRTTHKERPVITVPITLVVRGDLELEPGSAFFGFVKPGAKVEGEIVIRSRSGAEFKVNGAAADNARVRVGWPVAREGSWVVLVSMDTGVAGVVEGNLTVTTDVPGEERLPVPVYAHVREQS